MFRWDDGEAFEDAVVGLGNEAYGALCRGRKHCANKRTDGVLSRALALLIAPQEVWDRIAAVEDAAGAPRFIERLSGGAIRFVGFLDWNRTAAEANGLSEKRAVAGKSGGSQSGKHRAAAKATPEHPPEQPGSKIEANDLAKSKQEVQQSGSGSGLGSGSDLRGSAEGGRSVPEPKTDPSPRKNSEDHRSAPDPRRGDEVAIALQMRQHKVFRELDAHALAPMLAVRAFQWKKKLAWVLEAVDDCALKSEGLGLKPEALQSKLVGFIRNCSEPPAVAKLPGMAYRDDDPDSEPTPKMTAAIRAKNAAEARAFLKRVGGNAIGLGGGMPAANSTEAELADKARRDRERLTEAERKAGTG